MGVGSGWYYDSLDGMVVHQNLAESLANAIFTYYHGPYPTEQAAIAHKGVAGPPGQTNESLATQVGNATGNTAANLFGLPHWSPKQLREFALRGLKVVIGLALVIIGVVQLTHADRLITTAATVAKAVP